MVCFDEPCATAIAIRCGGLWRGRPAASELSRDVCSLIGLLAAETELVAGFCYLAFFVEMDFDHFFGLEGGSFFVGEAGDDFAGFDVDDVAGAWVGEFAVEGKRDPAGLVAEFD